MTKRKRIVFTRRELDMIINMCSIAEAGNGNWGEGDYIGAAWESKTAGKVMDSLNDKAHELLDRKPAKPAATGSNAAELFARGRQIIEENEGATGHD